MQTGRRWSEQDDARLLKMREADILPRQIAAAFGRTEVAVRLRLGRLLKLKAQHTGQAQSELARAAPCWLAEQGFVAVRIGTVPCMRRRPLLSAKRPMPAPDPTSIEPRCADAPASGETK
jgi:hypothetical protein